MVWNRARFILHSSNKGRLKDHWNKQTDSTGISNFFITDFKIPYCKINSLK